MENKYELIYMSRSGDEWAFTALFDQFRPMFTSLINEILLHNPLYENFREDMMQEAKIGLMDALNYYREDRNCRFATFVYLLVKRRLLSALRYHRAKSRVPLSSITALDGLVMENGSTYDVYRSPDDLGSPEYWVRYKAAYERLQETMASMRDIDRRVMYMWAEEKGYTEAGEKLGMTPRSYDARLRRVKKTVRSAVLGEKQH
ncbi:MAG: sigma-70 family RNA polymerase sigma factor [Solobacterium sp.]|nr:sigma-70 family RNA polymerase sigma factor [Solobacterium sp.]MBQ6591894.1 sigma-70 family RNA polymerase sigma factor [Solobacterium sp.]MBR2728269.1 sigma-70 family RNA polymerase sigma factor [Solobacterium sp.]